MAAGSCHDLHELYCAFQIGVELFGGNGDVESFAELWFLGGDSGGAIVGIANSSSDAADGLHSRVGEGYSISA